MVFFFFFFCLQIYELGLKKDFLVASSTKEAEEGGGRKGASCRPDRGVGVGDITSGTAARCSMLGIVL